MKNLEIEPEYMEFYLLSAHVVFQCLLRIESITSYVEDLESQSLPQVDLFECMIQGRNLLSTYFQGYVPTSKLQ